MRAAWSGTAAWIGQRTGSPQGLLSEILRERAHAPICPPEHVLLPCLGRAGAHAAGRLGGSAAADSAAEGHRADDGRGGDHFCLI